MDDGGDRRAFRAVTPVLSAIPQAGLGIAIVVRGQPVAGAAFAVLGVLAVALVLGVRRSGPAVVAVGAVELVALLLVPLPPAALLPVAVAVFRAAAAGARWWAVGTVAALLLLPVGELFLLEHPVAAGRQLGATLILVAALGGASFRRARGQARAEEAVRLADRQRIAVEQERVRIARELHDVLAHSLSSISVQAGVGLHLAPERPQAAVDALAAIRDASRDALDEVRGVLGVLRGDERAPLAPEPDLDALPALVEEVRRSGARVALSDDLRPRPPRPVEIALYRIVQESLTNARRHAPGAAIEVRLADDGGVAVARIGTDLPGSAPARITPGNGITGMQERAAQLGGSLSVAPRSGGVEVEARIPLAASKVGV